MDLFLILLRQTGNYACPFGRTSQHRPSHVRLVLPYGRNGGLALAMKHKTRTQSSTLAAGSKQVAQYAYPSGTFIESALVPSVAASYVSLQETIDYDEPRRKGSGNCVHASYSLSLSNADVALSFVEGRRYFYTYSGGYIAKEILIPRIGYATQDIPFDSIDWSQLSFQAMQKMRPDLSGGLNLAAALIELPKPTRMLQKWRKIVSDLRRDGIRRYLEHLWNQLKNNPKLIPRRAANLNLWYQFGLRPFVQDLMLTFDNLTTIDRRIEGMLREAGKPRTKHTSRFLDINRSSMGVDTEVWHDGDYKNQLNRRFEWISRPVYHATVTYILDADELRGVMGTVRGYIATLGLDKFLSTGWEVIPFSFLVDWFFNVNDYLDSLDNKLFGALPILILDFSHSVKWEYQTTILWKCWVTESLPGSTPKVYGMAPLSQCRRKYYERRAGAPALHDFSTARGLTVNRVGLASSLAISQYYRRR